MAKKKISNDSVYDEAISIVRNEKRQWDEATAFVTEKVAFRMRYLIRQLRKNYWGIFDSPTDPSTGRQKTWVPLSMSVAENIVKSIDMDPKDITFRARKPEGYSITDVTRSKVRSELEKMNFGRKQDEAERNTCIDGTVVWKTIKGEDKDGKPTLTVKNVDLLNVYIDPTEDTIQSAYRFTERSLSTPSEVAKMDGWTGTDDIKGSTGLARIDSQYRAISTGTTAEYVDVWEMWGKIPKSFITRKDEDSEIEIDGHIVVSGLETSGPRCHLIEENQNKDGLKPYEEVRYSKVANRWYGVGPLERIMWLQIWLNTIVNIRINRSYITQLGLYKIRKGSGITPAMLSRLSANGAVVVNNMDDMAPLETPSGDNSSYEDERVINDWMQKVTGAYDIAVGNDTPASSTATATAIQNTNGKSGFTLVKEEFAQFYKNLINRHWLPIIADMLTEGELLRFSDSDETFKDVVQKAVAHNANEALDKAFASGYIPSEAVMIRELQSAEEKAIKQKDFIVKNVHKIVAEHLDTDVICGTSDIDPNVMIQQLTSMLPLAPEYKTPIINEVFDLMGLPKPKLPPQSAQPQPMVDANGKPMNAQMGQSGNMPPVATPQSMQQQMMGANTQQQAVNR